MFCYNYARFQKLLEKNGFTNTFKGSTCLFLVSILIKLEESVLIKDVYMNKTTELLKPDTALCNISKTSQPGAGLLYLYETQIGISLSPFLLYRRLLG